MQKLIVCFLLSHWTYVWLNSALITVSTLCGNTRSAENDLRVSRTQPHDIQIGFTSDHVIHNFDRYVTQPPHAIVIPRKSVIVTQLLVNFIELEHRKETRNIKILEITHGNERCSGGMLCLVCNGTYN